MKAGRFLIVTILSSALFATIGHAQLARPKAMVTPFTERDRAPAGASVRLALRVS